MDLPRYGAHHQDEGKSTMERYAKYVEIDAVTVCSTQVSRFSGASAMLTIVYKKSSAPRLDANNIFLAAQHKSKP